MSYINGMIDGIFGCSSCNKAMMMKKGGSCGFVLLTDIEKSTHLC